MPTYVADRALLPGGWAEDVLLEVDGEGVLGRVSPDGAPADAERIPGVVVPGVPNLHSHAFQRGMAGLAERPGPGSDTFWSWRDTMYRFLGRLEPDDVQAIAAQLYVEMLGAGYTSVAEFHYLHHGPGGSPYEDPAEISLRLVEAARQAGIGLTLLPAVYTAGGFGGRPPEEAQRRFLLDHDGALDLLERLRPLSAEDPRLRLGLALHSLRAVPPEELAAAVVGARRIDPGIPIHIHVAEQEGEVEACLAWSGARPVAWLLDHAPVSPEWCLVHCTHLSDPEVEGLAGSGAVVGLCPTTEANLGDGVFPLPDFLGAGGRFGIGSDSHVSVSPAEELRWLEYAQRLLRRERNVAPGNREESTGAVLLGGALSGGAGATGAPVGALEAGRRADLVVLDPEHPVLAGREGDRLLDAWIFSGNRSPVTDVMVGGAWVVRAGRHPRAEEILEGYRATVRRLA